MSFANLPSNTSQNQHSDDGRKIALLIHKKCSYFNSLHGFSAIQAVYCSMSINLYDSTRPTCSSGVLSETGHLPFSMTSCIKVVTLFWQRSGFDTCRQSGASFSSAILVYISCKWSLMVASGKKMWAKKNRQILWTQELFSLSTNSIHCVFCWYSWIFLLLSICLSFTLSSISVCPSVCPSDFLSPLVLTGDTCVFWSTLVKIKVWNYNNISIYNNFLLRRQNHNLEKEFSL